MVPCGNRRGIGLSLLLREAGSGADAYHLMRAGLCGGSKGVPNRVYREASGVRDVDRAVVRCGPHRGPHAGTVRPCGCGERHRERRSRARGSPSTRARMTTRARCSGRHTRASCGAVHHRPAPQLARAPGLAGVASSRTTRGCPTPRSPSTSGGGLVHFHAVIRVDGPDGPEDLPPAADPGRTARGDCDQGGGSRGGDRPTRPDGSRCASGGATRWTAKGIRSLRGLKPSRPASSAQPRWPGYVAKYATKGTGGSDSSRQADPVP